MTEKVFSRRLKVANDLAFLVQSDFTGSYRPSAGSIRSSNVIDVNNPNKSLLTSFGLLFSLGMGVVKLLVPILNWTLSKAVIQVYNLHAKIDRNTQDRRQRRKVQQLLADETRPLITKFLQELTYAPSKKDLLFGTLKGELMDAFDEVNREYTLRVDSNKAANEVLAAYSKEIRRIYTTSRNRIDRNAKTSPDMSAKHYNRMSKF